MTNQTLLVLDYGGPYKEQIARRVRECKVYSRIESGNMSLEEIKELAPIGIIITGADVSVNDISPRECRPELFELGIPVLGIGYGMHAMTAALMGRVEPCANPGRGSSSALIDVTCPIFEGLCSDLEVFCDNTDEVTILPRGFENFGRTESCRNVAMGDRERGFYGLDFHPENDPEGGSEIIRRFLYSVCGAKGDYDLTSFVESRLESIRATVGNDKVMLALSGGIDSAVCAALLAKALPGQVYCLYVDHGFAHENELCDITSSLGGRDISLITVDARAEFLEALSGICSPTEKKTVCDRLLADIFRRQAKKLGDVRYIARGTVYTDIIASLSSQINRNFSGISAEELGYRGFLEPIASLFKDEVRMLGRMLGLSKALIQRRSFPGLGFAARIIGEVTEHKLEMLREADAIFSTELQKTRCQIGQHFAVLTDISLVDPYGKQGYVLVLRAVTSCDSTTAEYAEIPHRVLSHISLSITSRISDIVRVVYDVTTPAAAAEWM